MRLRRSKGFSLLEVTTVMVVIAIIVALMAVGIMSHKNVILTARTRVQFLQYESAINMYCREYGGLPDFFGDENVVALNEANNSEIFIKILSGKNCLGTPLSSEEKKMLNPKGKTFHNFAKNEFFLTPDGKRDNKVIADAFNNTNIFLIVESPFDDDVIISKEKFPESVRRHIKGDGIKNTVAIFSVSNDGKTVISNCFDQRL